MPEPLIPTADEDRQEVRMMDYFFKYFPEAQIAKARHSHRSNLKHNGKEGMSWAPDKSVGDGNQILRHLFDASDACFNFQNYEEAEYHLTCLAWRADELYTRFKRRMPPFDNLPEPKMNTGAVGEGDVEYLVPTGLAPLEYGWLYYGKGPLHVDTEGMGGDIAIYRSHVGEWCYSSGVFGASSEIHYAVRAGSQLAKLCGLG